MRSEVLAELKMLTIVFWVMTPRNFEIDYQYFGGILRIEAICMFEMLVITYKIIQRCHQKTQLIQHSADISNSLSGEYDEGCLVGFTLYTLVENYRRFIGTYRVLINLTIEVVSTLKHQ
jgi:hypothetical protein